MPEADADSTRLAELLDAAAGYILLLDTAKTWEELAAIEETVVERYADN